MAKRTDDAALVSTNSTQALAPMPPGLPFGPEEWQIMTAEERTQAIAFFREEQRETTEGLDITFPRIPYPTSGASFFEVPSPTGEAQAVKTLEGIVVYKQMKRAYWPLEDAVGKNPPLCSSLDAVVPVESEGRQAITCAACQYSKFGTGKESRGQACKQRLDTFLLLGTDEIPTLLSLPPSALKAFSAYAVQLRKINSALLAVTTILGLTEAQSQGGIAYKALTLKIGRNLTFVEMEKARAIREAFEHQMARRGIAVDEAAGHEDADAAE